LTAAALCLWPWQWVHSGLSLADPNRGCQSLRGEHAKGSQRQSSTSVISDRIDCWDLHSSLFLAAFACVLRPTNILIWLCVGLFATITARTWAARVLLLRQALICGSVVFVISSIADRFYYEAWTFPPVRFIYFNVAKSLAVFYGRNRADYYLTEGLPLLLTTVLPFSLIGIWKANPLRLSHSTADPEARSDARQDETLTLFARTAIFVTLTMSLIAHKEVRFLFPILPILHVLAARPLASFFQKHPSSSRKALLCSLVAVNVAIAFYTSQYHQRGVIDVLHHLRHEHESKLAFRPSDTTVGFLMPCHSTPWRSHLVHPSIIAWALTCEPPLDIPLSQRSSYMDEADQFYADPAAWLKLHMRDPVPKVSGADNGRRDWPQRLVFFAQLEEDVKTAAKIVEHLQYQQCWRGFNSHWHDDWRRQGDVVVWCRSEAV